MSAPTPTDAVLPPAPAPAQPRRARFDDRVASSLLRAPWIAASIGVHALLAAVVFLFGPKAEVRRVVALPDAPVLLSSSARDAGADEAVATAAASDAAPEPDPTATERFVEPDAQGDPVDAMTPPHGATVDEPPAPDPRESTASDPAVETGPDRSIIGLRVKPVRPPELPPEPVPTPAPQPVELPSVPPPVPPPVRPPTVDEEYATDVNGKAAARIKVAMRDPGSGFGRAMRGVKSEDLLVVSNGRSFDHLENVLDAVSLPYAHVSVAEFATRVDLSRTRVVFWNCGPPIGESRNRAMVAAKIAKFVEDGGFLWSTDWGLRDVVAAAFPGRLSTGEDRLHTLPELVVDVRAADGAAADPLLEGTLPATGPCRWWLEAAACEVRVLDPSKVTVLLEAPVLATAAHRKSPVLAATFTAGRGRVLHVLGHAWQEKTDLDGTVGMQRLALNFVRMRVELDAGR